MLSQAMDALVIHIFQNLIILREVGATYTRGAIFHPHASVHTMHIYVYICNICIPILHQSVFERKKQLLPPWMKYGHTQLPGQSSKKRMMSR